MKHISGEIMNTNRQGIFLKIKDKNYHIPPCTETYDFLMEYDSKSMHNGYKVSDKWKTVYIAYLRLESFRLSDLFVK